MTPTLEGQILVNSISFALCCTALAALTALFQGDPGHFRISTQAKALCAGISLLLCFAALSIALGVHHGLLALGISLGMVCGLMRPSSALCFFLICISIRPWELLMNAPVLSDLTELSLAICLGSLGIHYIRNKFFSFYISAIHIPFVLFLVWILLGTLLLGHMQEGLPYFSEYFTPIVALMLLLPQCIRNENDLRITLSIIVLCCFGIIAQALHLTLTAPQIGIDGIVRLQSTAALLGNSNDLASMITLALPIAFLLWVAKSRFTFTRILGILICAVFIWALWLAQSRGAILALGLSVAVYFFSLQSRGLLKNVFVFAALGIALFFVTSLKRNFEDLSGSSDARWNYFLTGMNMLKSNPLFGVGIGNYPHLYEQYTTSFYEWGERTAHSSWTLAAAETGGPGLVFFALMFLIALRAAFKLRTNHPEYLLALVAYTVAISFLSHTYFFYPYLLCILTVSAASVEDRV